MSKQINTPKIIASLAILGLGMLASFAILDQTMTKTAPINGSGQVLGVEDEKQVLLAQADTNETTTTQPQTEQTAQATEPKSEGGACASDNPCNLTEQQVTYNPDRNSLSFEDKKDIQITVNLDTISEFNFGEASKCEISVKKATDVEWKTLTSSITDKKCLTVFKASEQNFPYWKVKVEVSDTQGKKWIRENQSLILKIGAYTQSQIDAN